MERKISISGKGDSTTTEVNKLHILFIIFILSKNHEQIYLMKFNETY